MRRLLFSLTVALVVGWAAPPARAVDKTITEFTALTTADTADELLIWDASASATRKITISNFKTSLSLQPLDADLTSIAALTTSSFGRGLLEASTDAAARTLLGLGTAALSATGDFEPALGNPGANGYVLSSTAAGVRSWIAAGGTGDALVANPLSQFAATTSAQLAGVITNETGSGAMVFGTSPTLSAPTITSPSGLVKADVGLGNVENTALSTWTGSGNITTLGTIGTGTWNGSVIAPAYLGSGTSISTKYLRGDGTWQTISGGGDAMTSGNLSQFAATTSAQFAGVISDETGSGALVFGTSPTFTTPTLGAATATSVNGLTITTSTGTLSITNGKTLSASNTITIAGTDGSTLNVGAGGTLGSAAFTASTAYQSADADLTTWAGITPATGVGTFLGTPSSANLAAAVTDESGSGSLVLGTSATLTTPTISGAITFPDDVRQTFNPGAAAAGLNVGGIAGDPSTPSNGDLWYDSTANELTARINGANVALGAGGGGSFDPASPGAIGGTTPSTAAFYSSTITPTLTLTSNAVGASNGAQRLISAKNYSDVEVFWISHDESNGAGIGTSLYLTGNLHMAGTSYIYKNAWADIEIYSPVLKWGGSPSDTQISRVAAGVLGLTAAGTGGAVLEVGQSTALGTVSANSARLGAKDVSGTAELFVKDEAGNETQISPHAQDAPASLYDADEPFPQVTREANDYLGIVRYVNQTRLRDGRSNYEHRETFTEHNTRLGLTGERELVVKDWNTVQAEHVAKRDGERMAWLARKTTAEANNLPFTEPEPPVYVAKAKPQWLVDAAARLTAFSTRKAGKDDRRLAAYTELKNDVETLLGITINSPDELESRAGELLALANQKRAEIDAQGTTLAVTRQAVLLERKITNLFFRFTVFLARK